MPRSLRVYRTTSATKEMRSCLPMTPRNVVHRTMVASCADCPWWWHTTPAILSKAEVSQSRQTSLGFFRNCLLLMALPASPGPMSPQPVLLQRRNWTSLTIQSLSLPVLTAAVDPLVFAAPRTWGIGSQAGQRPALHLCSLEGMLPAHPDSSCAG